MILTKLFLTGFACAINIVFSFNVDTTSPIIFQDTENRSYFGYSVALHKNAESVIVGAPLSTKGTLGKGGTVFECKIATRKCEVLIGLDKSLPNEANDAQWMGASVHTNNIHVLACAPRSVTMVDETEGPRSRLHGKCVSINLMATLRSEDVLWKPCANKYRTDPDYDTCQAGFSAKYFGSEKGYTILSGLPNVLSGVLAVDYLSGNNVAYTSAVDRELLDYTGYAATAGRLKVNPDGSTSIVGVGGAPRGNNLHGQVFLYEFNDPRLPSYTSALNDPSNPSQTGSYFGSAVATADIDGNKIDDLIVAAPYYSDTESNQGAVYVYINKGKDGLVLAQTIYSSECDPDEKTKEGRAGALFGYALGTVGDLNNDGYSDIAIGAPWGGKDKKGVVCLFYGSRNAKPLQFKQIIRADIDASLDGFGFSFAEYYPYPDPNDRSINNDVDLNKYPDLAIGAYRSNRVVVLKSRPVASVFAQLDLGSTKQIDLGDTSVEMCNAPDGQRYKCIPTVTLCFTLNGTNIGDSGGDVNYTFEADSGQTFGKRGFMFDKTGKKLSVIKKVVKVYSTSQFCSEDTIYLVNNTRDIFQPLVVTLRWGYQAPNDANDCPNKLCPIANQMFNLVRDVTVPYVKGCNDDGNPTCNSDLDLTIAYRLDDGGSTISVGETKEIYLDVGVKNFKENAFINKLRVVYPEQLTPNNVIITNYAGTPTWEPNATPDGEIKTLVVTLNSPIGTNVLEKVTVVFGLLSVSKGTKSISINAAVKTESEDRNPGNDNRTVNIGVSLKAYLTVSGNVLPEQIKWSDVKPLRKRGPIVKHMFYFKNNGPSSVDTSDILIRIPEKLDTRFILNIYKVTLEGDGSRGTVGTCVHGDLNPLGLDVQGRESADINSTLSRNRRASSEVPDLGCGGSVLCRDIKCTLTFLPKNVGVTVMIYSTLVEATFDDFIKENRDIKAFAKFTSTAVDKPANAPPDSLTVSFTVLSPYFTFEKKGEPVAWWIILLCILAAILIIALIVFVMYKVGFFKRKRMDEEPDPEDDENAHLRGGGLE